MKIKLFGTANDSIVDGPGIRYAVFTQGCPHNCTGCHNPDSHNPDGGYWEDTENIINSIKKNSLLDGVTLSGGEPFMQARACAVIAKSVHMLGLNVITYTGFTFEELLKNSNSDNCFMELLENTDILVDGKFILSEKSMELNFKGSANQRLINVPRSLLNGMVVLSEYN
ncbi:MAG: anaerobic ribonucleoside-triphosphate reductase activating protein [Clostridia bacterium]